MRGTGISPYLPAGVLLVAECLLHGEQMRGLFGDKDLKTTAGDSGEVQQGIQRSLKYIMLCCWKLIPGSAARKSCCSKQTRSFVAAPGNESMIREWHEGIKCYRPWPLYRNNETSEAVSSLATTSSVLPRGPRHPALNNEETYLGM
jgi:hypothetical protein